jgi:hypothetical protein
MISNPYRVQHFNTPWSTVLRTRKDWETGQRNKCKIRPLALYQLGVDFVIDRFQEEHEKGNLPLHTGRVRFHAIDTGIEPNHTLRPTIKSHHQDSRHNFMDDFGHVVQTGDRPLIFASNGGWMRRTISQLKKKCKPDADERCLVQDNYSIGTGYRPLVSFCNSKETNHHCFHVHVHVSLTVFLFSPSLLCPFINPN